MDASETPCNYVDYILEPPTVEWLELFLKKSGLKAKDIVRTSEALYSQKYAGKKISDKRWIGILHKNPIMIQRPLVMGRNKAWIGRDEGSILDIQNNPNMD